MIYCQNPAQERPLFCAQTSRDISQVQLPSLTTCDDHDSEHNDDEHDGEHVDDGEHASCKWIPCCMLSFLVHIPNSVGRKK
jgi:hypothetical protein